jgi:hypothetical protein
MALPLPVSAGASERVPDPILEVIERHRRAYHAWMDGMGEDEIEALIPKARRKSNIVGALYGATDWQVAGDDPRWIAHIENGVRTSAEHDAAAMALVEFETITRAGVVALLEYVASVEKQDAQAWPDSLVDDDDQRQTWHYFLMTNLAATLGTTV